MISTEPTELTFEFDDEIIDWTVKRIKADLPIYVYCDNERFISRMKNKSVTMTHLGYLTDQFAGEKVDDKSPDYKDYLFFKEMLESYPGNPDTK